MLREGMFIAERYEIIEKIGSGGMSDVYKAKCHKLNRYVAIKVLKNEYSEDKSFVSKFRAEAQSAAGLMHANIVNVYDVGEENGIYYIVMELVEGITLKKYIEKKGRLGIREAVSIAIQVAQGMDAAHKHKIVHRDIKPQNIMISKEGKVKVTDFGIAKAASSNTINSTVMGSVHYISPEQARGGYSDDKGDIYSFGIMLFEMLTGRVPFEGDTTVAVALQHIQDDIVSPKEYVSEIPISVEKIVLKCTQKKAEKRYQNAMDLIADLKRSLVTPDEDFVVIASAVATDAPTQMIDAEDMETINAISKHKAVGLDVISPSHEGLEDVSGEAATEEDDDDVVVAPAASFEDDEDINLAASKKIDKIIAILGISVGVVILVITIIIIFKLINMFSDGNKTTTLPSGQTTVADDGLIEVPTVIGYTYEQAKEILNNAGLGIKESYDFSSAYEEGVVFWQSIDGGTRTTPNSTVIVTISKGAVTFVLPDVLGNTQAAAEATLKAKDLKVSFTYEETDNSILWGTVKSSDPASGTNVKSGDVVTLVIYTGPDVVNETVPVVKDKGYTVAEVKTQLENLKFTDITVLYEYDEEIAKGVVISITGATEGEKAPVTTPITIVASKGPDPSKATEEPTTEEPTTEAPTEEPTTEEPTTEAPTTEEPTTEEPTTEEPTTEEPTTEESTTEAVAKISESVTSDQIDTLLANLDINKSIKITYFVSYVDSEGTTVTDKQISSTEYTKYSAMVSKAPFKLDVEAADANVGDAVSIKIVVTYFQNDAEEATTVETSVDTTFK